MRKFVCLLVGAIMVLSMCFPAAARAEYCDICLTGVVTGKTTYSRWIPAQPRQTRNCVHPGGSTSTAQYYDVLYERDKYKDYTCSNCGLVDHVYLSTETKWVCGQN